MVDFIRQMQLSVGGTVITGLRMRADITQSATSISDTSTIEVYNLSSSVYSNFRRGDSVVLNAGYVDADALDLIFRGYLTGMASASQGGDARITMYVGSRAILETESEKTYAGSVPVVELLRDLLDTFADVDYTAVYAAITDGLIADSVFDFVASGNTRFAVNALLDEAQIPDTDATVSVSVDNNDVVRFHIDGRYDNGSVFLVSEATGMIGTPQQGIYGIANGVSVRSRLTNLPALGGAADVQSANVPTANGRRKIVRINHAAGNGGNDPWHTELELHDII